jgi:LCP family protein required for cell wall assembly
MKSSRQSLRIALLLSRVLTVLNIILAIALITLIVSSQLLPLKYLFMTAAILLLLAIFSTYGLLATHRKKVLTVMGAVAAVLLLCSTSIGLKLAFDSVTLLSHMTNDSSVTKSKVSTTQPFNLYISGIDTYGDITTVSRSDVNIIASINPQTKQILLTTVPRDAYVRIAGGGNNEYDKLTHAGIYGVSSSMQTLAQLMDIELSTYARINFTSLISIVDKIGGIDVSNPITFKTDSGQVFTKGMLHLNGKDALTFSRERHNLEGGDNDRGMNQQRVIAAIITKLSSPQILKHYQSALIVLGDAVQMNLSHQNLSGLINRQLDEQGEWAITMAQIAGKGQTGGLSSYAMPASQLYMFVLDENSLQQAKSRIQAVISSE